MSVFVQKTNVLSGKTVWELQDEHYDYHQEIARSMYADMLHDTDRNKKYFIAIKKAIQEKHKRGEKAHVLDIGTGTGLLSMMAATCKADSIVACEAFPPIAGVAKKVIEDNGMGSLIKVVAKRSTEMEVGPGKDMEFRANILVTEVFDTELIGEGAIETFNHAHEHLLEEGAIVIPWRGHIYATIADSNFLALHNKVYPSYPVKGFGETIKIPSDVRSCKGSPAVHDFQLSQLDNSQFNLLSKPVKVFTFDFSGKRPLEIKRHSIKNIGAKEKGEAQVVLMWWDLDMDPEASIVISCAPNWFVSNCWRDHWMQAVYYLKNHVTFEKGDPFSLISVHDQYSLWFEISLELDPNEVAVPEAPSCTCGLHVVSSRSRIAAMNSIDRLHKFNDMLQQIPKDATLMYLGDLSFMPLFASKLGIKKVYCVEENPIARDFLNKVAAFNELGDAFKVLPEYNKDLIEEEITHAVCEPYVRTSIYPWDNLRCWYLASEICPEAKFQPLSMKVYSLPMEFHDLHKIRAPLGCVEGFEMDSFDKLIKVSSEIADSTVETQPLWEYPGVPLGEPVRVIELELTSGIPSTTQRGSGDLKISQNGICHGIALWVDWITKSDALSSGPTEPISPGVPVQWDMVSRQGVYFFPNPRHLHNGDSLKYNVTFEPTEGNFSFHFEFKV